ncbi:MAG: YdcF family protein [Clostridia bacterium]|nr:YdcF family protein [Clostridia bacterium]
MKTSIKILQNIIIVILCLVAVGVIAVFSVNGHVKSVGKKRLLTAAQAAELKDVDCILVLGCSVRADGSLSDMLRDRLTQGIQLYKAGVSDTMLVSGDHGQAEYNEVGAMKKYAVQNGVPSERIFMDHAGFSTYETVYRAKEIFGADKVLIVTQEYHLYRALYIAEQLGIEAYGVSADLHTYAGQSARDVREILARCKDFAMCIFKPEPTYLGTPVPLSGSGDLTEA